ncbi:hypothetical protein ABEB36_006785 [Hypothenemus hampei]|uniref:Homeobox protein cut-like n=1 Tax=Hypothenemus hampei TaxID=57062 RepID=A0ABD1ERQ0_HYPHA
MQPTTAANVPQSGGEMDLQAMQSMEWLFKKERIYLLAQFWQQRATLAEKEVTTLKEQLSGNNCENKDTSNMDRQSFETEIATKDKEINQLLEEVQRLQGCISKIQESSITQITRLEEQLEQKRQHIARLETKLDLQKDYDELKRQVTILKSDLVNNPQGKDIELLLEKTKIQVQEQRDKSPSRESDDGAKSTTPNHLVEKSSTASTPQPMDASTSPHEAGTHLLVNGTPKSPHEDNNNVNNNHNNNIPLAATFVNNFLRGEDSLKSPYRFEEHRSPFKFAEDLGMAPGSMVGRLGESLIPKGDPMEARLQEMLRYNMDKYASQNLDTLHIARRVRELLSIHNIGQRLFAKYILGLSQGTVSELLSKPKPWDKLTEKGRDSYRKMHAWACDENAIMLLKSLIPKKDNFSSSGKEGGAPLPFGRPDSSDLTEERLAHILSEANSQFSNAPQHLKGEQSSDLHSNEEDSKSPHGCTSPFSKESSLSKRLKKYENDDISQEKVVRIYQEELAKLMGRRMEDLRSPRDGGGFPQGMFLPQFFSNIPMDRSDEIRMALDAYHRELAKLNQNPSSSQMPLGLLAFQQQALQAQQQNQQQNSNGGVQDLSLPKDKAKMVNGLEEGKEKDEDSVSRHSGSAFSLVRPKLEPGTTPSGNSSASSPLGNSILPPMTPTSEDFSASAAASPLQRMASITNSLISQPPTQPHHTTAQRPLKAVLPPITQQQFDLYNNLNTEDIVKKVKEQLSQYSISQRLFGESVLGLSQGSVSDLLARPKPWHMLTQKGREPFIRMKMFLEDGDAVHKLVASQYKIAPEKLMRTGGYGNACASSLSKSSSLPTNQKILSEAAGLLTKMQQDPQSLLPTSLQLGPPQVNQTQAPPLGPPGATQIPQSQLLNHLGLPPHHAMALQSQELLKKQQQNMQAGHGLPTHSPLGHQGMRGMHQHMSPSVYEMAALTQDLDTQVITTKIKEALLANNIGQKIFGEAVLGLSQGSVSELLSKPKPWHMLSIKGREPFIRMQLWLQDTHNVDRLQALKNERREANKRRRSSGPGHDNSSDTSSNDTSEFYHSNSPGPQGGPANAKKQRVLFSEEQKEALRLAFALDPYPNVATIEFLAQELSLSSRTITNWFHNHRMRLKQQVPHGIPSDIPPRDQNSSQQPFDPVQFRVLLNQRLMELSKERMGLAGVPLPYNPYLAANPSLAALISRGLLPAGDLSDLSALNNAVKEQMSGLDLSMTSLKREPNEFEDDDDVESNVGSEDSQNSGSLGQDETKNETGGKETNISSSSLSQGRTSRRKPAAPMWVNPHWEEEKNQEKGQSNQDEVIINGVCVMQTDDNYAPRRGSTEETVRVEPQAVLDRFEDDRSETSSVRTRDDGDRDHRVEDVEARSEEDERHHHGDQEEDRKDMVKVENEDERWDIM